MITKVQKWGNNQGLRLSKEILSNAEINAGDAVKISVYEGSLVITPVHQVRGRLDLKELVKHISKEYQPSEMDWGVPTGKEVW